MAIADTIISMQNHTSNAYTMIGYGTDLTGINKNLENLSTSIFNAFLEALRNPDTLFTNLPKKSGTGANITLNDTANAPMRIELGSRALEQATTLGTNLIGLDTAQYKVDLQAGDRLHITNQTNETMTFYCYSNYGDTTQNDYWGTAGNFDKTIILAHDTKAIAWSSVPNGIAWINKGTTSQPYEPYTGGIPAPNPSYPQDVHTISGSNKVVVCGKNLFDEEYYNNADLYNINVYKNTLTNIKGNRTLYTKCTLKEGKTTISGLYLLICNNQQPNISGSIQRWFVNGGSISSSGSSNFAGYDSVYLSWYPSYITPAQIFDTYNLMVSIQEETSYEPYVSQETDINLGEIEYSKIGNYEDKFIRNSGKNLFDIEQIKQVSIGTSGGTTIVYEGSTYRGYILNVEGLTNITISRKNTTDFNRFRFGFTDTYPAQNVSVYTENWTNGLIVSDNSTTTTLSIPSQAKYLVCYFSNSSQTITTSSEVQIEKGTTATQYEPYGSNEWYIKKNIGKVVLDGSENWTSQDRELTNSWRYFTSSFLPTSVQNVGLSNRFKSVNANTINTIDSEAICRINYQQVAIRLDKSKATTLEEFKTWLSNNNTTLYYVLENPTYTEITGTLANQLEYVYKNMLSQKGQTNISQVNNDLSFELSVSALEDLV